LVEGEHGQGGAQRSDKAAPGKVEEARMQRIFSYIS
jgi:hypothetical protein